MERPLRKLQDELFNPPIFHEKKSILIDSFAISQKFQRVTPLYLECNYMNGPFVGYKCEKGHVTYHGVHIDGSITFVWLDEKTNKAKPFLTKCYLCRYCHLHDNSPLQTFFSHKALKMKDETQLDKDYKYCINIIHKNLSLDVEQYLVSLISYCMGMISLSQHDSNFDCSTLSISSSHKLFCKNHRKSMLCHVTMNDILSNNIPECKQCGRLKGSILSDLLPDVVYEMIYIKTCRDFFTCFFPGWIYIGGTVKKGKVSSTVLCPEKHVAKICTEDQGMINIKNHIVTCYICNTPPSPTSPDHKYFFED